MDPPAKIAQEDNFSSLKWLWFANEYHYHDLFEEVANEAYGAALYRLVHETGRDLVQLEDHSQHPGGQLVVNRFWTGFGGGEGVGEGVGEV